MVKMNITRVLALLQLFLSSAHSFSWDIVVGEENRLEFYRNRTLTHTVNIPWTRMITSVTYDPVHDRVLFTDANDQNILISSLDLSTRKLQHLVCKEKPSAYDVKVVYDPVTQLLFWKEYTSIYSLSLNPASSDDAVDGNLLFTLEHLCYDIAVDSCGGYIYWITNYAIERARFNGSEREVLIQSNVFDRRSLAIDQQAQKMYWTEATYKNDRYQLYIESADLNGNSRRTLYTVKNKNETYANSLTVSNNFIYWRAFYQEKKICQLPKNPQNYEEAKLFSNLNLDCPLCQDIAAKYSIKEQTEGNPKCEALKNLTQNNSEPESTAASLLCRHGIEVSGESRGECAQGYTGERCDVSLCHNYCLHGDCSVSAEGQPKCSCKIGYSGGRCEVNACSMFCLNNGVCSLNELNEPFCQCTADYEGERCDVPAFLIKWTQTISMLRDVLNEDIPPLTLSKGLKSTCASTVV